jgi:hypothetical protein
MTYIVYLKKEYQGFLFLFHSKSLCFYFILHVGVLKVKADVFFVIIGPHKHINSHAVYVIYNINININIYMLMMYDAADAIVQSV